MTSNKNKNLNHKAIGLYGAEGSLPGWERDQHRVDPDPNGNREARRLAKKKGIIRNPRTEEAS